jgi:hypothetical protein
MTYGKRVRRRIKSRTDYRESMPRENVRDASYAYMLLFATVGVWTIRGESAKCDKIYVAVVQRPTFTAACRQSYRH